MKTITFVCTIVHVIGEIKFFTPQVQGCSEETAPVEFRWLKNNELTPAQIPLVKKDMEEQFEGAVQ